LLYNSPIFCIPKKQGQGLRIVQEFRELNQNSHIDKYSMKEITKCISDIGQANSNIFYTLDLTSGFWQMKLDEKSQPLTAFTIPGKGQCHWVTSPMGLLGCPASFQRLMEGVLQNLQNVIVYIDDLLKVKIEPSIESLLLTALTSRYTYNEYILRLPTHPNLMKVHVTPMNGISRSWNKFWNGYIKTT
jgi:hypothetical protein